MRRVRKPIPATPEEVIFHSRKVELEALSSQAKGAIAEYAVASRLSELGFIVWMPFVPNGRADMAVAYAGRVVRLQVKSATFDLSSRRFRANFFTKDKDRKHIYYSDKDIDFVVVHCFGIEDKYIIPASVVMRYQSANLIPHREMYSQVRGHKWEPYKNAFHLLRGEM